MNNPFEVIEQKLSNIENLLLTINNQPKEVEQTDYPEQLLTVDELAAFLHLSKATIYSNYSKGLIPGGCKQSKRLYFDKKIITDWIKAGRKLTNAEIQQQADQYLTSKNRRAV